MSGRQVRSFGFALMAMLSCLVAGWASAQATRTGISGDDDDAGTPLVQATRTRVSRDGDGHDDAGSPLTQATRTWVSGVGDDANPCSRTAPCKTLAGAISKTSAGGEIDALDPGAFGAVTITKSITIDGGAGVAGVMVAGTNGIVIQAGAADVVRLRNLDINGLGQASGTPGLDGIRFLAGASLQVHNVHVYGFSQHGIGFEVPGGAASTLVVTDSQLENNAGGAVLVTGAGTPFASLTRVSMAGGQRGLRIEDGATAIVRDSTAANHAGNGFIAVGTSRLTQLTLDRITSFGNAASGVFAGTSANVYLRDSSVINNGTGLTLAGGSIISSGNNTVQGNTVNGSPSVNAGQI